ncbi:hypothetical protein JL720_13538 [Aureococcus anophagefferens]|nr:hypothetical protein JL720_13538 [Aureococcus anophagefferens]
MLVIRGSNLAAPDAATGAPLTSCRFDGGPSSASSVDAAGELATCVTPDLGLAAPRAVDLEVAANGFDFERGGIDVAVFGQNFAPTAQLSCRFGASKVVAAVFVSEARVTCAAPAGLPNSKVCVEVTINGDDYTSDCAASLAYTARPRVADASPKSSTALDGVDAPPNKGGAKVALALALNGVDYEGAGAVTYSYANRPTVASLAPKRGPGAGDARRDLRRAGARAGVVALAVAADADAAWSDAAPFAYYGPEAVDAAVPAVVAVDGTALDMTVKLREALPASAAAPRCVFSVAGEPARSTPAAADGLAVACALPAAFRGAPGTVAVRVAANGVDASASFAEVEVVARPEVLSPRGVFPLAGGELARVPATFVSAGEARCFPVGRRAASATAEISNGAAAESRDEALLHFVAPLPIAASNAAGTVAGGAVVTLDAAGRLPGAADGAFRCRFGARTVVAARRGASTVECAAPKTSAPGAVPSRCSSTASTSA